MTGSGKFDWLDANGFHSLGEQFVLVRSTDAWILHDSCFSLVVVVVVVLGIGVIPAHISVLLVLRNNKLPNWIKKDTFVYDTELVKKQKAASKSETRLCRLRRGVITRDPPISPYNSLGPLCQSKLWFCLRVFLCLGMYFTVWQGSLFLILRKTV